MHKNRLAGRFLPSRVYARWIWTVRCSVFVLPTLLFLAGASVMFLQPCLYESKAAFKYLGDRPLPEVKSLLESGKINQLVTKELELGSHWDVDSETAVSTLSEITEIQVDSKNQQIEVKVAHANKEDARDIAASVVNSLIRYEEQFTTAAIHTRLQESERSTTRIRDEAETKKQALAMLISIRSDVLADPVAQLDILAARSEWESTLARAFEIQNQIGQMNRELSNSRKWVEVHTHPQLAQFPAEKKADESLGELIIRVLLVGLVTALTLPYLLEFVCPRRPKAKKPIADVNFENPNLLESAVNG